MKHPFLKFLAACWTLCALLLLVAFAPSASAQTYTPQPLTLATNTIAASTTESGDSSAFTLTRWDTIGLQITFQGSGAGTGTQTLIFKHSVDGTTYSTVSPISIGVAANGTTAVCVTTNLSGLGVGYLKLDSWQNGATNSVTNCVIKIVGKPRAPAFPN